MTKIIKVTNRRLGTGKTTVASILAEKLAETHKVCLIDNNRNNINIYSSDSSIENINLYACLTDKESKKLALKESATILKKNLYFFSGGRELLTEEKILMLKEQDIYDYIIFDCESSIDDEIFDCNIVVVNPNKFEYESATEMLIRSNDIQKNLIVINRYTEGSEFKFNKQDFKLNFSSEIINFANGFMLNLTKENENEVIRIIERITGNEMTEDKPKTKFRLLGRSK